MSRQTLTTEADRVFSLHIRNRGASNDYNTCYTCNAYLPIIDLQCGHFRPRRYLNTRWHPVNAWPQCNTCNVEKSGNLIVYEAKLRAQFGDDAIDGLFELSRSLRKVTEEDIRIIIKKYRIY